MQLTVVKMPVFSARNILSVPVSCRLLGIEHDLQIAVAEVALRGRRLQPYHPSATLHACQPPYLNFHCLKFCMFRSMLPDTRMPNLDGRPLPFRQLAVHDIVIDSRGLARTQSLLIRYFFFSPDERTYWLWWSNAPGIP